MQHNIPSDPVKTALALQGLESTSDNYQDNYNTEYLKRGLHLPAFYITLDDSRCAWVEAFDGSLHEKVFANRWSKLGYSQRTILEIVRASQTLSNGNRTLLLLANDRDKALDASNLTSWQREESETVAYLSTLIRDKSAVNRWFYPYLSFHGANNQYHQWIAGLLSGDLGKSLLDATPVWNKIWPALQWTLLLVLVSLFLSLVVSFPLGIYNGMHTSGTLDRWSNAILFGIYSIPRFWLATLLVVFFTTIEYGKWTNIFPSVGMWSTGSGTFTEIIANSWTRLILPILIIIIADVAYLARLIRSTVIEVSNKEYINTAKSKGISYSKIVRDHIIPNALTPVITLLAGVLPGAISSSLIIEVIFNIPGMGRLLYDSILSADWAVVYPIVFLVGLVSVLVFLIADIVIAWLNPKIDLR